MWLDERVEGKLTSVEKASVSPTNPIYSWVTKA